MEVMDELQTYSAVEDTAINVVKDTSLVVAVVSESCEKGGSQLGTVEHSSAAASAPETLTGAVTSIGAHTSTLSSSQSPDCQSSEPSQQPEVDKTDVTLQNTPPFQEQSICENSSEENQDSVENMETESPEQQSLTDKSEVKDSNIENDTVAFKTEVLVEQTSNETAHNQEHEVSTTEENEHTNNILSELGQNIELSEVLRSSDTIENGDNSSGKQEMFNKEELLEILEGNNITTSAEEVSNLLQTKDHHTKKIIETQIALNQLSRLKKTRKPKAVVTSNIRKKRGKKVVADAEIENKKEKNSLEETANEKAVCETPEKLPVSENSGHILDVLAKDWDDDEIGDLEESQPLEEAEKTLNSNEESIKVKDEVASSKDCDKSSTNQQHTNQQKAEINKSGDEAQTQRRFGRVIKKKVIFDPDNPDTFTKSKIITKHKDVSTEKEESTPTKKSKLDETKRSKSKSPMSKMTWKKPPPKTNNKHNKRLTEVDKLLMDEGAVNMIYQLTPEAPKGKKNMKTKAEFIKKLQSSTPESKEMKFRERKKEKEEAKKHVGLKQRSSLSGSVKSLSVCDDFETQSADDSIIYRRHSSSSYSSTCMSPRRLSDVDMNIGAAHTITHVSQGNQTNGGQAADIFVDSSADLSTNQLINKDDCLSIKEKLNSKLSQVLNKRKRESTKGEKVPKQSKKMANSELKIDDLKLEKSNTFKHIVIKYLNNVAVAHIKSTEHGGSIEVLKELTQAIKEFDNSKITSVTLLTSESGALCSELNMRPMLDINMERRTNYAYELAETIRLLFSTVEQHSKLIVSAVWSSSSGLALPLLALSDVALASEDSTFAFGDSCPKPGVSIFTAGARVMSHKMINDLVIFGHRISASDAQTGGLVSRTLWPRQVDSQVQAIANDLGSQPKQSILLKKKLLNLKKTPEYEAAFFANLEKERDLMVQYWTSVEGQEMLRKLYNVE